MKLYTSARSPYGRKVRIVLLEKGVPFELVVVDLTRRDEAFYRKNPIGKIPFLDTGAVVIPDSTVICEHLEDRYPNPPMYEKDRLRCRILEELADSFADQTVLAAQAAGRGDEAAAAKHLATCDRILVDLKARMDAGEWPPGFTVADAALIGALGYHGVRHGNGWRDRHPAIADWYDRQHERPSVRETAPAT